MKISNSSSDLSKQYRYEFLQSRHTAGEGKENKRENTAITGRTNILVSWNKSLKDTKFFLTFCGDAVGKSCERLVKQLHHYASQLWLSINCLPHLPTWSKASMLESKVISAGILIAQNALLGIIYLVIINNYFDYIPKPRLTDTNF